MYICQIVPSKRASTMEQAKGSHWQNLEMQESSVVKIVKRTKKKRKKKRGNANVTVIACLPATSTLEHDLSDRYFGGDEKTAR